ncbi:MAG TPA: hypothetical protein VN540_08145 [Clostridia bacterium]|nr:hypothetical protein [Clostridia bacterium]
MDYLTISRLLADDAASATDPAAASSTNLMMVLFKAAIAVYLLVVAIRGKGKLIENQFPKCPPKTYRLVMRLLSAFAALVILANSAFEFLSGTAYGAMLPLTAEQYGTINTVLWAVGLVGLLALIVVNILLTDRKAMEEARKKQDEARRSGSRGDPLRAAFVFDEEDEKQGEFARKSGEEEARQGDPKGQA